MPDGANSLIDISPCCGGADFDAAIRVTRDYLAWLDLDLSFQSIDQELAGFPAMYGPPHGRFLLARVGGEMAGGVGLRFLEVGICEMKRLYVYDRFQGLGIGRRLCEELIVVAGTLGYERMRLDTLERMQSAVRLYRSLGFVDIEAYCFNPEPTARYMELMLDRQES